MDGVPERPWQQELRIINLKIDLLHQKQNEIVARINEVIERMNKIPRNIREEKEHLMRKAFYLERDIDQLKHKANMPDEDV